MPPGNAEVRASATKEQPKNTEKAKGGSEQPSRRKFSQFLTELAGPGKHGTSAATLEAEEAGRDDRPYSPVQLKPPSVPPGVGNAGKPAAPTVQYSSWQEAMRAATTLPAAIHPGGMGQVPSGPGNAGVGLPPGRQPPPTQQHGQQPTQASSAKPQNQPPPSPMYRNNYGNTAPQVSTPQAPKSSGLPPKVAAPSAAAAAAAAATAGSSASDADTKPEKPKKAAYGGEFHEKRRAAVLKKYPGVKGMDLDWPEDWPTWPTGAMELFVVSMGTMLPTSSRAKATVSTEQAEDSQEGPSASEPRAVPPPRKPRPLPPSSVLRPLLSRLGINDERVAANPAALKTAYRKAALKWHPDKNPGNKAAAKRFMDMSSAYNELMRILVPPG